MHRIAWLCNVNLKIKHNFYNPKNWKTHIWYTWNKTKKNCGSWTFFLWNWIACNGLAKHYSPTSDKRATKWLLYSYYLSPLTHQKSKLFMSAEQHEYFVWLAITASYSGNPHWLQTERSPSTSIMIIAAFLISFLKTL